MLIYDKNSNTSVTTPLNNIHHVNHNNNNSRAANSNDNSSDCNSYIMSFPTMHLGLPCMLGRINHTVDENPLRGSTHPTNTFPCD